MGISIWWIRRDLRLHDNAALAHALNKSTVVIPLFILDPALLSTPPANRDHFLFNALRSLDADLQKKGSRLIVRKGRPIDVFGKLTDETGADLISAEADFSPYAKKRDAEIGELFPLVTLGGPTVHPPQAILKTDGTPYTVYTPFSRAWKSLPQPSQPLAAPDCMPPIPESLVTDGIPVSKNYDGFPANEMAARERLEQFLSCAVFQYKDTRNILAQDGTARISPYFKFGLLSIHEAAHRVFSLISKTENQAERGNCVTWLNELIWREFYFSILSHFPDVTRESYRKNLRSIRWSDDQKALHAWQEGLTGYPVVDAAMRQLKQSGWMHNRARMISASFLTKDLLIDWREGEQWFMQRLIDGDLASNNGGWQWTSGTGTDAAPYFRIFNPILQSKKFDPQGEYIRRWVPELSHVSSDDIHTPRENPDLKLDYPPPIIDHSVGRERALAAYQAARLAYEDQSR